MGKVRFFLMVETVLLVAAMLDTLSNEAARFVLMFLVLLLLVRFWSKNTSLDAFLISMGILFVLLFVFNLYFIVAILLGLAYGGLTFLSRYLKRNQYSHVVLDEEPLSVQKKKNTWLNPAAYFTNRFAFEDVNINRAFGNDILDLEEALVQGQDNVIVIRKIYGATKIVVPIDVEVSVSVTSVYGQLSFLGLSTWDLRNEEIFLMSPHYKTSQRRVKIVISTLFGNVEVVRV